MLQPKTVDRIKAIIDSAKHIVIVQADNPDVDSLASSLALEAILEDQGKKVTLYCGVDLPSYLHYLPDWGRINRELPKTFNASIIVDTSSDALLEQLDKTGAKAWLAAKPSIVLDHHTTDASISFANVIANYPAVATAELVEGGVNLAELESLRRESLRRDHELIHYKGQLLQRVQFHADNRIATVTIPWEEIEKYSPSYNPSM